MDWLGTNWGNLASVLGLAISMVVLFVSQGARRAANEAREAISRRSLVYDLRECSDAMNLLNVLYETQRWEIGAHTCYRSTQALAFVISRWAAVIDEQSAGNLNLAASQLDTVNRQLRKFQFTSPKNNELKSLGAAIRRINSLLTAEMGKYESQI